MHANVGMHMMVCWCAVSMYASIQHMSWMGMFYLHGDGGNHLSSWCYCTVWHYGSASSPRGESASGYVLPDWRSSLGLNWRGTSDPRCFSHFSLQTEVDIQTWNQVRGLRRRCAAVASKCIIASETVCRSSFAIMNR